MQKNFFLLLTLLIASKNHASENNLQIVVYKSLSEYFCETLKSAAINHIALISHTHTFDISLKPMQENFIFELINEQLENNSDTGTGVVKSITYYEKTCDKNLKFLYNTEIKYHKENNHKKLKRIWPNGEINSWNIEVNSCEKEHRLDLNFARRLTRL